MTQFWEGPTLSPLIRGGGWGGVYGLQLWQDCRQQLGVFLCFFGSKSSLTKSYDNNTENTDRALLYGVF